MDYEPLAGVQTLLYDLEEYGREYDGLEVPGLKIRRGMEFGMEPHNADQLRVDAVKRHYDFILGSVHFVGKDDVYFASFWEGRTVFEAERRYLEEMLACVRVHDEFDVLAHLSFISRARAHHAPRPLPYAEHREILDEILKTLGLSINNTKGIIDVCKGLSLNDSYWVVPLGFSGSFTE